MTETPFRSPEQIAAFLDVKQGTLAAWRTRKVGPPFHRFGNIVRYNMDEVKAWAAGNKTETVRPADPDPAPAPKLPAPMPAWLQTTSHKSNITGGSL